MHERIYHRAILCGTLLVLLLLMRPSVSNALEGAPVLALSGGKASYDLDSDGFIEVYEDREGTKGISDMSAPGVDGLFKPVRKISYGYTKSVFWLRFSVKNGGPPGDWMLECGNPLIDRVDLYRPTPRGGFTVVKSGRAMPFDERPFRHRNIVFPLDFRAGEAQTLYLRFETQSGASFPLKLWGREDFSAKEQPALLLFGFYYGIAVVMSLFNLSVYYYLRDKIYLLYVFCVMPYVFAQLCLNGIGYQFLWPGSPWWESKALQVFMSASIVGAMAFTAGFLRMKIVQPSFYRVMMVMCGVGSAGMLLSFLIPTRIGIRLSTAFTGVSILFIFLTAFLSWRKGFKPARTFFLAWSLFLAGVLLNILRAWGVLPANFLTQYSSQIGSGLHVIVLSLALTERINIMREEKDHAQAETQRLNKELQEHSMTLERKVEERTAELVRARDVAEEANRIKSDFLSTVSHELRTPLTSVLGFAKIIQNKFENTLFPALLPGNPKVDKASMQVRDNIGIIVLEGERLTKLINDVLDIAKMEAGKVEWKDEPTTIAEVIDRAVAATSALFNTSGPSLVVEVEDSLPEIRGDRDRLIQVLINLISNAVKFTPQGTITVNALLKKAGDREVFEDSIELSVSDTGIGISAENHALVFEKFRQIGDTLTDKPMGTGLGLPISKQIVEHHGGSIWLDSELGKGSTFFIRLPLLKALEGTDRRTAVDAARLLREHVITAARSILDSVYTMVDKICSGIETERQSILESRKRELKNIVLLVESHINHVRKQVAAGELTEEEAKKKVLEELRTLQYGNKDYIYVSNLKSVFLSHPDPTSDGADFSAVRDIKGGLIIPPMIEIAQRDGEGYHSYWWKRLQGEEPKGKIAYCRLIPEWEWVVGTGVYIDDIEDEAMRRKGDEIDQLRLTLRKLKIAKTGYIYVFDSKFNMIIHPNPNIEGTNVETLIDPLTSRPLFHELINASRLQDYKIYYKWDKPEDPGNYSYDKIAWVRHFEGFDWYIGSSVYLEELYDESGS